MIAVKAKNVRIIIHCARRLPGFFRLLWLSKVFENSTDKKNKFRSKATGKWYFPFLRYTFKYNLCFLLLNLKVIKLYIGILYYCVVVIRAVRSRFISHYFLLTRTECNQTPHNNAFVIANKLLRKLLRVYFGSYMGLKRFG